MAGAPVKQIQDLSISDDFIIALAGAGTALSIYAGGTGAVKLTKNLLDRLGISELLGKASPTTLERLIGMEPGEALALGSAMAASAAVMWEMKHPYLGKAVEKYKQYLMDREAIEAQKREDAMALIELMIKAGATGGEIMNQFNETMLSGSADVAKEIFVLGSILPDEIG